MRDWADADPNTTVHPYTPGHPDADPDAHANADTHADTNAATDADSSMDPNTIGDTNCGAAIANAGAHPDGRTNAGLDYIANANAFCNPKRFACNFGNASTFAGD
ncbi:MAG TPA: hypothetical protein VN956_25295 [Pyrinomonadaceae bacterium]|nr:hypothetical protein [Pyrinomonadaceae bacterium]